MLNYIRKCENHNGKGYCEAFQEDCDGQCILMKIHKKRVRKTEISRRGD